MKTKKVVLAVAVCIAASLVFATLSSAAQKGLRNTQSSKIDMSSIIMNSPLKCVDTYYTAFKACRDNYLRDYDGCFIPCTLQGGTVDECVGKCGSFWYEAQNRIQTECVCHFLIEGCTRPFGEGSYDYKDDLSKCK